MKKHTFVVMAFLLISSLSTVSAIAASQESALATSVSHPQNDAHTFICPSGGMRDAAETNDLRDSWGADLLNHVDMLIYKAQQKQPNISYSELTDRLVAIYCPVIAKRTDLTQAEKQFRMTVFTAMIEKRLATKLPNYAKTHPKPP